MNRICSALIAAAVALAPPSTGADERVDEVVVTAKRRVAELAEVSSATSLVGAGEIAPGDLVTDALVATPGVFLQQTTPGQGAAIVRGLTGSAVLHLVDGMRLNNAMTRSAPTQYLALVPVGAVERVEVVRGTPAALYGSDAVGGVVQVVTRRPRFDSEELQVRGRTEVGYETAELARAFATTIDAGTRDFVMSLAADYLATGNRRTGGGERIGPSGFESAGGRLLVERTTAPGATWSLDLHWAEQPGTPRIDELVPGFGQSEPSAAEFLFAPNRRVFVHGRRREANGPLGLDWTFDAAWQQIVDDRRTRETGAAARRLEANASDLYGAVVSAVGGTDASSWIAGAEFYHDRVTSGRIEEDVETGTRTRVEPRFPDGSTVRQAALFGSVDRRVGARHLLSAGVRLSHVAVELAATDRTDAGSLDAANVSGDIGWVFEYDARWQLVANAGFGFRAPNVFDLGTLGNRPGNRFNVPNADLDSEHVVQGDAGLRWRGERLRWELVAFALRYRDRITSVGTGEVTADGRDIVQSLNAARSSLHGVETGFSFAASGVLTIDGFLNAARGEQRIAGQPEEPADRMPPVHGRFRMIYDADRRWRLLAALRFAGPQDRLSERDREDPRIDPAGTPGWAILDLEALRRVGAGWHVGFAIGNVLDHRFRRHGSGLDAPGRGFALTIRRDWAE